MSSGNTELLEIMKHAREAAAEVGGLSTEKKNNALKSMAESLLGHMNEILDANEEDVKSAGTEISVVMIDRLTLSPDRIEGMAKGILDLIDLQDPVGRILETNEPREGLLIKRVSVPIGVIAIIYESRPNVTSDAAALTLKSGNVVILRSGKEAFRTAAAIVNALREGLKNAGVNENAVNLVPDTSRECANILMTSPEYVDLLIPRGGAGLISACVKNATVPCIQTGTGICHVYVESTADQTKALKIIENAKTSRPSVCNAEEVLIVDKKIAAEFLPKVKKILVDDRKLNGIVPVELRLDEFAASVIAGIAAGEKDFDTEFLDYILAVKCVDDADEAIRHINEHSTGHSDAIISNSETAIAKFISKIDSSSVYVNASTRFTDGGEFGLGCEMGISTQKLHARGPMGLRELTTYKYVITGDGHIR